MHTIDLNYMSKPGAASAFLLESTDGPVLIESGPMSTIDTLCQGLRDHGVEPKDVRHVVLTHIHLDHAGAAGWFADHGATVHVHPRGARHLIDPTRLNASAIRVYGEDVLNHVTGLMHPVPADCVHTVLDGESIDLGSLSLTAIETPGHASHHHAWATELDEERLCFTGDIAGMRIPGTSFITIPLAPPELDQDQWHRSIERVEAANFDAIMLTHSGKLPDPAAHLRRLHEQLDREINLLETLIKDSTLDDEARIKHFRKALLKQAASHEVHNNLADEHISTPHAAMSLMGIGRMLRLRTPAE